MLYATFDVDVLDDPAFQDLQDADAGHPWRLMRLIQVAKRYNVKGRICRADGVPMDAKSLARLHDGRGAEHVSTWEAFLELATALRLIEWDTNAWRIAHWSRWHRAPSDEPEQTAQRKRDQRDRERQQLEQQQPRDLSGQPVTSRDIPTRHGCHETEQSIAEHEQSIVEQNIAKHDPPPTPRLPQNEAEAMALASLGGGRDVAIAVPEGASRDSPQPAPRFLDSCRAAFKEIDRGWSARSEAKARELHACSRDDPAVTATVLLDCLRFGVDSVKDSVSLGEDIKSPWDVAIYRAIKSILPRLAWGEAVKNGAKLGFTPQPWRYQREAS